MNKTFRIFFWFVLIIVLLSLTSTFYKTFILEDIPTNASGR